MKPINTAISETWDERGMWVMALICGVFAGLGALVANIVLPHIVESTLSHAIVGGFFSGAAVLLGVIIFSMLDT